jgi:uracil-DNA glycosylase
MSDSAIKLTSDWKDLLLDTFSQPYMLELKAFLKNEKSAGRIIYPGSDEIFNAFNTTPLSEVKIVLLGQDPYHGPGQAHGLSFSVKDGVRQPPSLQNIFKELESDLGVTPPTGGNLTAWARQGVLLLNAVLTVRANEPASHQGKGWEQFTDTVIRRLSESKENLVFLLWGRFAQSKSDLIDEQKHLVLRAAHPSPFSAHSGFFGCKHFSKANAYLTKQGINIIEWRIS